MYCFWRTLTLFSRSPCLRGLPLPPSLHRPLHHPLHTSPPHQAWFLLTPLARFGVALGARVGRWWWRRLPPERRQAFWASLARKQKYIYGSLGFLSLGCVGYYYHHLEDTPITGRRRFVMFSRKDVQKLVESEREWIIQAIAAGGKPLRHDDTTFQIVLSIASQILSKNWGPQLEGFDWTLYVVDKPDVVNAICLPTGDIFVFTGLMNACRNTDELAFIMSHEIAHAVLGHGAEALSHKGIIDFFSLFLIASIWAIIPSDLASYFLHSLSRSTAEVLFDYPYSRALEAEADEVGLTFAAKACFDPGEAAKVWTHLPTINKGDKVIEYLSTHPSNERRYENLTGLLPMAYGVWQRSECEAEMREEVKSFTKTVKDILKRMVTWE